MKPNATASKSRVAQSLVTATGALAVSVSSNQAATSLVQITLIGNQISSPGGNLLNADVTGDKINDLIITDPSTRASNVANNYGVFVTIDSQRLSARSYIDGSGVHLDARFAIDGVGTASTYVSRSSISIKYLNLISFTDARINGGVATQGYLEVSAFNVQESSATVALTRLIFNPLSTTMTTAGLSTGTTYTEFVPEPSSFALLALGAGGLLARRRQTA